MINYTLALIIIQLLLSTLIFNKSKRLFSIISVIITLIASVQFASFIFAGKLIEPLALTNLDSIEKIGWFPVCLFLTSFILFSTITVLFQKLKLNSNKIMKFSLVALILTSCFKSSPIGGAVNTIMLVSDEYQMSYGASKLKKKYAKKLLNNKIVYESDSNRYIENKKYNVVIIFAEGMSYDIISKKRTPNLYNLINHSITVENYFNHTAATFRGLRGQLTSTYQILGGYYKDKSGIGQMDKNKIMGKYENKLIISLPDILNKNGYNSYFQVPSDVNQPLPSMLSTLGFDKIFGLNDVENPKHWSLNELTDKDSFSLILENIKTLKEPFFYGVYTVGTHVGLDSPDDKYGNGRNEYLNKFYNLDVQFGHFLNKFNQSSLSKNTIVIFTTDHASYPSPSFKKAFNIKNNDFIDRIPFIIYKKGLQPSSLNVHGMNSLSTASTVLDILGIKDGENRFLGMSLFDKQKHPKTNYITAIGSQYFTSADEGHKILKDKGTIKKIKELQQFGE
jgi:arylsulfatase A-like enzyme